MHCPRCHFQNTRVVDSRTTSDHKSTRRRRQCEKCNSRFTTFETAATSNFIIIKKDGSREPYNRDKIAQGVWLACTKRKITQQQVDNMLNDLEKEWVAMGKEVPSPKLGEGVMAKLKEIDEVAYIRFASVYREFKDTQTFKEELQKLLET